MMSDMEKRQGKMLMDIWEQAKSVKFILPHINFYWRTFIIEKTLNNQVLKTKCFSQLILASLHHWSLQHRHNGHINRLAIEWLTGIPSLDSTAQVPT